MGYFGKMKEASMTGGGVYFLEGIYRVRLVKVHMYSGRKGDAFFIVEAEIIESNNPQRPVGMKCSQVIKMSQDAALGNIKAFLAAANGIDIDADGAMQVVQEEITEEVAELAVHASNPLAGIELKLQCTQIKTQAGNDFTRHDWRP